MTVLETGAEPVRSDGLSRHRRIGILLICSMSLLIVGLDVTIVNVALPSIGRDFHAPLSGLQWTVDAYTLVLASLLMLSGSTADRFGRRRTFVIGLVTFAAGSLLCSLAPNLPALIVFRMVQAVGGSMLNPVAMSIITNTFTVPRERAQAIGVWAAVVGVSWPWVRWWVGCWSPRSVGGRSSGSTSRSGWWPWSWPCATSPIQSPRSQKGGRPRPDFVIPLLSSLTYGIIEAPEPGLVLTAIVGAFAVAAVSLVALVLREHRLESRSSTCVSSGRSPSPRPP